VTYFCRKWKIPKTSSSALTSANFLNCDVSIRRRLFELEQYQLNEQKKQQDKRERKLKRKAFKLWCYQQQLKEAGKSVSPPSDQQEPEDPQTAPHKSTTEAVSTKKGKSIPGRKLKKSSTQNDVLNAASAAAAMIQLKKQADAKTLLVQQTDGANSEDESYRPSESSETESSKCGSTSSEEEFLSANSSVEKMFKKAKLDKMNKEPKSCSSKNISFDADRDSYLKAKEAYLKLKRKRNQINYSEDISQQQLNSSSTQNESAQQSLILDYGDEESVSYVTSFELEVDSHPSDQVYSLDSVNPQS